LDERERGFWQLAGHMDLLQDSAKQILSCSIACAEKNREKGIQSIADREISFKNTNLCYQKIACY